MIKKQWTVLCFILLNSFQVIADSDRISLTGLEDDLQHNVLRILSLNRESCESPKWRISQAFDNIDEEVDKALRALGHYHSHAKKNLQFTEDCWHVEVDVSPGPAVFIHSIDIVLKGDAGQDEKFHQYIDKLPLKKGDVLHHGHYEAVKNRLKSLALQRGYFDHQWLKHELLVTPAENKADITLHFDSGVRYQIGVINIEQNRLSPEFISRYIGIKKGQPFSSKALATTYNRLNDSPFFSAVEVAPVIDSNSENKTPVDIKLNFNKTHKFSIGGGYDTDVGPIASAGYDNRLLNQYGHHLSLNLQYSPVLSEAEVNYFIPLQNNLYDEFSVGIGYQIESPDTFESETIKLGLKLKQKLDSGWRQTLFIDLSHEQYTVSDTTQDTTLLVPGGHWKYSEFNHKLRPDKGFSIDVTLAGAPEPLISDVMFVQAHIEGTVIAPLPWYARVIVRGDVGATLSDDFDSLPTSYRFFAGGNETIRGYDYKELGPTDDNGDVIGGKLLSIASIEYEQFINKSWGVAIFADAGNAYNPDDFNLKFGVGTGVRWASPIGPINLDFALPLNESESDFQIHFSAGVQW